MINFENYARTLDDQRLGAEYKQQAFIRKHLREAGIRNFPLLQALEKELDRRNEVNSRLLQALEKELDRRNEVNIQCA
jgi:hypothetical protein